MRVVSDWGASMKGLLLAAALLVATAPAALQAKSVAKEFQEAWASRSARYEQQAQDARTKLEAGKQLIKTGSSEQQVRGAIGDALNGTYEYGYYKGRGLALASVQELIKSKPSSVKANLWMQDQIDQLQERARAATQNMEQARSIALNPGNTDPETGVAAMGSAMFESGSVKGVADELALMNQNLSLYFPAKSVEERQKRAAWAGVFQSIGQIGQNMTAQSQAMMNRNWSATCSTTGGFTRCSGN